MIKNPMPEKISLLEIAQLDAATIDRIEKETAHEKFIETLEHLIYMEMIREPDDFDRMDDDMRNKLMGHFMVAYHAPYERTNHSIDNRDFYGEFNNFACTQYAIEMLIGKTSAKEFAQDISKAACKYYSKTIKSVIEEYLIHNGYAGFKTGVDEYLDDPRRSEKLESTSQQIMGERQWNDSFHS